MKPFYFYFTLWGAFKGPQTHKDLKMGDLQWPQYPKYYNKSTIQKDHFVGSNISLKNFQTWFSLHIKYLNSSIGPAVIDLKWLEAYVLYNTAALLFFHIDETKTVISQSFLNRSPKFCMEVHIDSTNPLSHAKPYQTDENNGAMAIMIT